MSTPGQACRAKPYVTAEAWHWHAYIRACGAAGPDACIARESVTEDLQASAGVQGPDRQAMRCLWFGHSATHLGFNRGFRVYQGEEMKKGV